MSLCCINKLFLTYRLECVFVIIFLFLLYQEENGDYTYMQQIEIPVTHGALLIMEGATQADWQVYELSYVSDSSRKLAFYMYLILRHSV